MENIQQEQGSTISKMAYCVDICNTTLKQSSALLRRNLKEFSMATETVLLE